MEQELMNELQEQDIPLDAASEDELAEASEPSAEDSEKDGQLDILRAEIEELRGEIARRDAIEESNRRVMRECEEFKEYFPEIELSAIPDGVWESVKGGLPLAASYALYARKEELHKNRIDEINRRNKLMSAGSVRRDGEEKYYSPSEVRSMTRDQVKSNYSDIIESMRHWN